MDPKSPSKTKLPTLGFIRHFRAFKLAIAIVIIVLLILIGFYLVRNPGFNRNSSYFTVVLDCGSSGTRVNVYEWMMSNDGIITNSNWELPILLHSFPDNSTKIEDQKDGCAYHCMQTEPGLDSFVGNASGVKESLEPLIQRAEKWVPQERYKDTPIFVLATAGLRRLNQEVAMGVLDDIEVVVKLHQFRYRKDWIRVLSGREEAYYGWIALNYHMDVFRNSSRLATLGLLDLGGSSLQVATEIEDPTMDDHHDGVFRSKIGSFEQPILAASLPAFGLNKAFDRTVLMLLRERGLETSEISHPCLGHGFTQNYTCRDCFIDGNSPTQMRESDKFSLHLVGEPNWEKCKRLARAVAINSSSSSDWSKLPDDSNCTRLSSMSDENILKMVGGSHSVARFHALSGFFAVYNLLNLKASANLSMIWEKGQQLCSRSLNMPTKQKYADFLCFRVPYMVSLVENTLCIGDRDIVFGPGELSWTLGAVLVEGKDVWLSDASRARNIIPDLRFRRVILSPYFLFVLLAFLLFIVYRSQIKLPMPGRKAASLPSYVGPKRRPA
ncbi:probable apyrase 7 [Cynara cardunculus var. scolymus]|uniref:Nucleoside phosphatase GDA1/CD39 n=1 Tax=Cynara cardunculus var. scolymus TaxID=59895 RepID=A0A118K3Q6_CYNCS|nr:probable apyrase 7 [Cynara cardunculus var. scolymus]KVI06287.1 Nucleoside phosphatase GDA1/CD39 [Cynara cardunculus var. scolymus]